MDIDWFEKYAFSGNWSQAIMLWSKLVIQEWEDYNADL